MRPLFALLVSTALLASYARAQAPLKFMGRDVTVTHPGAEDKDGLSPKGPASVCLGGAPRQCYTMPDTNGGGPQAQVVAVAKDAPALLFTAASVGVSGSSIHFALLRPGPRKDLEDLFLSSIDLSNQSQHAFWNEPSISDAKIFVTADFEWGPDEAHHSPHRYIISSYLLMRSSLLDGRFYYLQDRYMTARQYDYSSEDILAAEKQEILARLLRVKRQSSGVR